jgi:hypothetical protein
MDKKDHILIITGAAPCLEDDLQNLKLETLNFQLETDFMAIGLDAVDKYLWPVQYFATYHPEDIAPARERRRVAGGNIDYKIITHLPQEGEKIDMIIPFLPPSGSSALLGVLAGLKMGYTRMILCGCPLEGKNVQNGNYENFREGWQTHHKQYKGNVKSMSGWTMGFLGAPTKEWING